MSGFKLRRIGHIMEPEPGNPMEVEGVLNPAVVRGPDSKLYLFPRLVAKGNYSRIGIARVLFNDAGDPVGSVKPVLTPELLNERNGIIDNVVFPTGIDRRDDLGLPDRFDVYYGMADDRIGVARLDLPDILPHEGVADPPDEKV